VGTEFRFLVTTSCEVVSNIQAEGLPKRFQLTDNGSCTATITGMPTRAQVGDDAVTLVASVAGSGTATQDFTLSIVSPPVLVLRPSVAVKAGDAFRFLVSTKFGYPVPSISSSSNLPGGVGLVDNLNGTATLAGTPAAGTGGAYPVSISASNGVGAPVTGTVILIVDEVPVFTSAAADTVTAGQPIAPFHVATIGYPVAGLQAAGLPDGITLAPVGNGGATIEGSASDAAVGRHRVVIRARNRSGVSTQTLVLTVVKATPAPTT
jgi:hypothetical protein